jgi:predicted glycoside hydrolase/deacetylase ChbG (UPF0249 family)
MPRPHVIVTADDFGLNPLVNAAIVRGFAQGLVTHASLLVNLEGFEEACRLVRTHQLQDFIGLHLNLTEGTPLTMRIQRTPLCADGRFVSLNRARYYRIVTEATRRAVAEEASAQIETARAAGVAVGHLDSHNDIHTSPAIAGVIMEVAKAHGIGRVRLARNCGRKQGAIRWLYHRRYNALLVRNRLNGSRYFGAIDDLLTFGENIGAPLMMEAMTHPILSPEDDSVIDAPHMQPLAVRIRQLLDRGYRIVARPEFNVVGR